MQRLETEQAIGQLICHDITKIEREVFKGALFKKGHRISPEDVEVLLSIGKKHIYVLELEEGDLHEDEAGERIACALAGKGLAVGKPSEGRLDLTAAHPGLFRVASKRLHRINSIPDVVVATLHSGTPLKEGEKVAGAKVVPLVVREETVTAVEKICAEGNPPLQVLPYRKFKIGGIITGREVVEGRVKDGFAPVLAQKAASFGLEQPLIKLVNDDAAIISSAIINMLAEGSNMVIVTGGMSVDPDDVTPTGIKLTGANVVRYGAPALPGAMFMLAYKGEIPLIGLPACAMYYQNTVLDILLPRLLAGEIISADDIAALGHGGLCRRCETCYYPGCSFGKVCF